MALLIHQTFQARSASGLKTMARTGILRQYRRDERMICADMNMAAEKAGDPGGPRSQEWLW